MPIALTAPGQVAGYSFNGSGGYFATVWNGTTPTELGNLPGATQSSGLSINNFGQVAGFSGINYGATQIATLWNGTTPTALGTIPGGVATAADGINNLGQVVGVSEDANSLVTALIWNSINPTVLPLLPGFTQSVAQGINDRGQIVGYEYYAGTNSAFDYQAVVWSPSPVSATPLPPTWTMMLIGLAGFGFFAYGRNSKPAFTAA